MHSKALPNTAHSTSRSLTLTLMGLGVLAIEITRLEPGASMWQAAGWSALLLSGAAFGERWLGRRDKAPIVFGLSITMAVWLCTLCPLLCDLVQRRTGAGSEAVEMQLLACLRNLGLAMLVLSRDVAARRLSALIGSCLIIFAATLSREPAVWALAATAVALGGAWLADNYWHFRHGHLCDTGTDSTPVPWIPVGLTLVLVMAVFGLFFSTARHGTTALAGFAPGSGGTGEWSQESQGGVHAQGDAEVGALKDASSTGFTDSNVFLESQQVSLYDTISDMYGNPKPPKERQRKIVVPLKNFIERHSEPAENHRADEQFTTKRQPPNQSRDSQSRKADALLYVSGRTPLHLRINAYDTFDGVKWRHAKPIEKHHWLQAEKAGFWLTFARICRPPITGGVDEHQIKIGLLKTDRVVTPGFLERFRIGQMNKADLLAWAHDDILCFTAPRFPPGTTFATHTRALDHSALSTFHFPNALTRNIAPIEARNLSLPESRFFDPRIEQLARDWVAGRPHGWMQVERITEMLKQRCTHDNKATTPPNIEDPVSHFLFDAKCGPDYLFATAAVLMLRSLGYPARVVSGFYVRPDRYDAQTRHTPVMAQDTHFWAEALLEPEVGWGYDRTWIPLEPTPGYELLLPSLTIWERTSAVVAAASAWVRLYAMPLGQLTVILLLLIKLHTFIADTCHTLWWMAQRRFAPKGCHRARILATQRLLDARSRLAGCRRAPGQTPASHLENLGERVYDWGRLCDWAAFAPATCPPPMSLPQIDALCCYMVQSRRRHLLQMQLAPAKAAPYSSTYSLAGNYP